MQGTSTEELNGVLKKEKNQIKDAYAKRALEHIQRREQASADRKLIAQSMARACEIQEQFLKLFAMKNGLDIPRNEEENESTAGDAEIL